MKWMMHYGQMEPVCHVHHGIQRNERVVVMRWMMRHGTMESASQVLNPCGG